MLKMAGAFLIILASTALGFFLAYRLHLRSKQLRQLQMSIQMLETEIAYASTPLAVAFDKLSFRGKDAISRLFQQTVENMQQFAGASTYECWLDALDRWQHTLFLKPNEWEWLRHFGQVIGTSDREDQLKHLRLWMTQLKKSETEALEEERKYGKMYKSLGFLFGLMLVILLI